MRLAPGADSEASGTWDSLLGYPEWPMIDPTSGGFTRGPGVSLYGRGPRRAN